mgnify:CR=1 FL=1
MFGLPKENVRVITKFVGSGFGSKLWPWTHCPLAVAAARQLGKPVKLVLSRKMMFQTAGHRRAHPAARAARRHTRRQARLAPARLRLPPGQCSIIITRDCGESDGVPLQCAEPAGEVRTRPAQRRLADRHARPRRRARALRDRVGDERSWPISSRSIPFGSASSTSRRSTRD